MFSEEIKIFNENLLVVIKIPSAIEKFEIDD